MSGGTSRGPYFLKSDLPSDTKQRDKILLAAMGSPDVRQIDGLNVYPLYCFFCRSVTEWASDPFNNSETAYKGVEYFQTRKSNKGDLKEIINYADMCGVNSLKSKIKKKMKKPKKRKSWYQKLFTD